MPRHGFVGTGSLAASRAYAWAWPVGDDVCLPLLFTCVCVCWVWHQHEYHLQHKHFSTGRQIGCQQSNTCLSFSVGVSSAVESEAVANPTGRPPQAIFSLSSGAFKWNWISNAEKATETRRSTWATVAGVASSCLLPLPAPRASSRGCCQGCCSLMDSPRRLCDFESEIIACGAMATPVAPCLGVACLEFFI